MMSVTIIWRAKMEPVKIPAVIEIVASIMNSSASLKTIKIFAGITVKTTKGVSQAAFALKTLVKTHENMK